MSLIWSLQRLTYHLGLGLVKNSKCSWAQKFCLVPLEPPELCWVADFSSDAGTLHWVCSEGHSNMTDLTLEMGCNLFSPRALCLILLIREIEKRVNPLCVVSEHSPPLSLSHSLPFSLSTPITGLDGTLPGVT